MMRSFCSAMRRSMVGDSRLNVLQFSSRDHCLAPPSHADTTHARLTKMCATTHDVMNVWVPRGLFNSVALLAQPLLPNIPGTRSASKLLADVLVV